MHRPMRGTLNATLSCFAILLGSHADALDPNPPDFYSLLDHQPIAGIPTGPYRDWTDDERIKAFKLIKLSCIRTSFAGMMSLAQEAAEDRKKEEILTLTAACIAMHLPEDHPARKDYQTEALKHYDVAKSLGSDFPPPAF